MALVTLFHAYIHCGLIPLHLPTKTCRRTWQPHRTLKDILPQLAPMTLFHLGKNALFLNLKNWDTVPNLPQAPHTKYNFSNLFLFSFLAAFKGKHAWDTVPKFSLARASPTLKIINGKHGFSSNALFFTSKNWDTVPNLHQTPHTDYDLPNLVLFPFQATFKRKHFWDTVSQNFPCPNQASKLLLYTNSFI